MASSKNVQKPQNKQVAKASAFASQMAADAGAGFEEASRDAFAIPFLRILQDLSPQVKPKMSGYIKGAKPGQIFNTVTQSLVDEVTVIPCHFLQRFIEWVPRTKKGGFVAAYDPVRGAQLMASTVKNDRNANVLPNGNELMDSREHYCLVVNPDGTTQGVLIAMASSGLKVSRRWMTQMRNQVIEIEGKRINAPMFAFSYKLITEEQSNDQGSWYIFNPTEPQQVEDESLYLAARAFRNSMASGAAKVNYDDLRENASAGAPASDIPNDLDADGSM